MIIHRTISQLLDIFVIPEIEKRITNQTIRKSDLPLEIKQFKIIQKRLADDSIEPIVKINDEVQIITEAKSRRSVKAGEEIALKDIEPEECYIYPPIIDGKQAAYFLYLSRVLEFLLFFDCKPNIPGISEEELNQSKIKFPIIELLKLKDYNEKIKPIEKLRELSKYNWPPAPGYYPLTLLEYHNNPDLINNDGFIEVVSKSYSLKYMEDKLKFWRAIDLFPNRIQYIQRSIDAHFAGDYICSIYVIVPQFEGIIKDYLMTQKIVCPNGFKNCVDKLNELIKSRKILLFPNDILDNITEYIKTGSFWTNTSNISDPSNTINRHGIAHGVFTNFESRIVSLKYMILLDALAYIILHEKILTNSLK